MNISENSLFFSRQSSKSDNDNSEQGSSLPSPDSAVEGLSDSDSSTKISLDRYEAEWSSVITDFDVEILKNRSHDGGLRASRFRSIFWRIFLKILGKDPNKWASEVTDHRNLYFRLQEELESSPWSTTNSSPHHDNPLSQDNESVWCRYFCDEELRSMIRQDVIRTFPGIDFFHTTDIQNAMIKILFIYAKKNPSLCYRQGMHEILAPILFILHCDEEALAHAQEMGSVSSDLLIIFDPNYLAPDAFAIFSRVMTNLESSYAVPKQNLSSSILSGQCERDRDNEIVWRLDYIRDKLLTHADPELAGHLQTLDIPLQIFGIRWLRLLFGREFPLQDLLMLWDVIFTTDDFYIVDYIVVSMLIAIRHLLLNNDYTTCLSHVMRYPSGVDVSYILHHAHHLVNPQRYPPPPRPPTCSPAPRRSSRRRTLDGTPSSPVPSCRHLPPTLIKNMPIATGNISKPELVDGYVLQESQRLRMELDHLRAVMALVRIKISQYRESLLPAVVASNDSEAHQALDGLRELCNLMVESPPPEVEPADEALSDTPIKTSQSGLSKPVTQQPRLQHAPELEVFKHTLGGVSIDGAPMVDPLHRTGSPGRPDSFNNFYKEFNQLE